MRPLLFALAVSLLCAPAAEAAEPVRVAVTQVSGSIAFMLESTLRSTLKKHGEIEVLTQQEWVAAKSKLGDDYAALTSELGLAATVEAAAAHEGKGWIATITLRAGVSGKVLKTWKAKGADLKKLTAAVEHGLWKEFGSTITHAKPVKKSAGSAPSTPLAKGEKVERAEKAEKAEIAESTEKAEAAESAPAASQSQSAKSAEPAATTATQERERPRDTRKRTKNETALEVLAGLDFFARSFRYNDDLFGRLRPYTLSGAPALDARLIWYPAAHFTHGFAANLGIDARVGFGFGIESSDSTGTKYPTKTMELELALRGRLPLGTASELALLLGYGRHGFSVNKGDTGPDPELPEVAYSFLRAGAEARFALIDELSLRLALGWRPILSAGPIQDGTWFPRSSAGGIDGSFSIGYALFDPLEVLLGMSGRHYFYTMNPEPGDPRIAGGAADDYLAGTLMLSFTL